MNKIKLKEIIERFIEIFNPLRVFVHQPRLIIYIAIICISNMFISRYTNNLGGGIYLFVQTPIITFIYILIALSNPIESICRKLEDLRRVATIREKEYLYPIFDEVYSTFKKNYKDIGYNVELYIIDTMKIESFAIGKNTIAITRGMIELMSYNEIKGILAHEFSHIALCHSQIQLIIAGVSNIIFWIAILIEKLLFKIIFIIGNNNFIALCLRFVRFLFSIVTNLVFGIANLIILSGRRKSEYIADEMAVELGYGNQLKSALYKIYDIEVTDKKEYLKRIYAEHPRTAYRIENIENLLTEH